jgi:hypothetical protein
MTAGPQRHERAAQAHARAAVRHGEAADFWVGKGDAERADLERRNWQIELDARQLELDRAELERRRPHSR